MRTTPHSLNRFCSTHFYFSLFIFATLLSSCSVQQRIARSAKARVLQAPALQTAHVGISIYDPASGKYLYNYQGDKYFVPASNTKIATCYAAMKYLGDSLVGLRYQTANGVTDIFPAGDPGFLHKDFAQQPVLDFLRNNQGKIRLAYTGKDNFEKFGSGWSWNDYNEYYMAERSLMPLFGNVFTVAFDSRDSLIIRPDLQDDMYRIPLWDETGSGRDIISRKKADLPTNFRIKRLPDMNTLVMYDARAAFTGQEIPVQNPDAFLPLYLSELLGEKFNPQASVLPGLQTKDLRKICSRPTDSLLKPLMHRSDNFFAEQSLLMVSNEKLGFMNDAAIIDTILKTDFKDLPQAPRWADGSGLSRYNLFTPQDFVMILHKMEKEFGMERIKAIFPTGGEGTISAYYKKDAGFIFGKTGTLSGVVAFSGFLYTKKGKLLLFSTLVNNHRASATDVRKAIEKFLTGLREKY